MQTDITHRANWPPDKLSWCTHVLISTFVFVSFLFLLQEKCAQYWPRAEEREMTFRDTRFTVTLLSEDIKPYYTTRVLQLENISVSDGELGRFGPVLAFLWSSLFLLRNIC